MQSASSYLTDSNDMLGEREHARARDDIPVNPHFASRRTRGFPSGARVSCIPQSRKSRAHSAMTEARACVGVCARPARTVNTKHAYYSTSPSLNNFKKLLGKATPTPGCNYTGRRHAHFFFILLDPCDDIHS